MINVAVEATEFGGDLSHSKKQIVQTPDRKQGSDKRGEVNIEVNIENPAYPFVVQREILLLMFISC